MFSIQNILNAILSFNWIANTVLITCKTREPSIFSILILSMYFVPLKDLVQLTFPPPGQSGTLFLYKFLLKN